MINFTENSNFNFRLQYPQSLSYTFLLFKFFLSYFKKMKAIEAKSLESNMIPRNINSNMFPYNINISREALILMPFFYIWVA